jgi:outer membrane receptor protein involved in Fe transport
MRPICIPSVITVLILLLATASHAKQNTGENVVNKRVLEEVIVTAQKRAQSLQDIPMSVSEIGGDVAAEAAVVDAADLVQCTPNVKFTASNPAYTSISIRGFGTPPLARNFEASFAMVQLMPPPVGHKSIHHFC